MKILCFTPLNEEIKTPETSFAETLIKYGHDVILFHTRNEHSKVIIDKQITDFKPDVIFSMMEYSLPVALKYKELLNIPLYAHIECIPPWRTGIDNPKDYGLDLYKGMTDSPDMRETYKILLNMFDKADYRTISQELWRYSFEKFSGKKLDAGIKYYTYDTRPLKKYKGEYAIKNQICTIARFVPIKRIHHIITALSLIDKSIRPSYALIGYGNMISFLKELADGCDVNIHFYGSGKDGVKEQVIQESMFNVQIFGGMPVIEAAYYNKPVVSYDVPQFMEVFGDSVLYAKTNDITSLKDKIEYLLTNKEKIKGLGEKANDMIFNDKTNIWNNERYTKEVIKNLNKAIENFEAKK